MTEMNIRRRVISQALLFAAGVFAVYVVFFGLGFNTVVKNYYLAGYCFVRGLDPYVITLRNGAANAFMYSPFFALVAGGVSLFPLHWRVLAIGWQLLGVTAFSLGLSHWNRLSLRQPTAVDVALAACAIDLLTSMSAYQINDLIIGLTLIALAAYRKRNFLIAGAVLVLAVNLKIYPVVFLLGLAMARAPLRFWIGGLVVGLVAIFLPAVVVGFQRDFSMHLEWLGLLSHDSMGKALLNLPSAFARVSIAGLNLAPLGKVLQYIVGIVSALIFSAHAISNHRNAGEEILWGPWITLGVAAPILMSPRTEVFTYVLLAPCYVLMAEWCAQHIEAVRKRRAAIWFVAIASMIIAGCRYMDPLWYHSESPFEIVRVLGALAIWGLAGTILASDLYHRGRRLRNRRDQPASANDSLRV